MSSLKAFPQLVDISPSKNQLRDLKIVKDFSDPRSGVVVELDGFELSREGDQALRDWLYNLRGRFENPEAYFTSPNGTTYDMFINLRELGINRRKGISGSIEMRKSFKHFFDNADQLTFNLLKLEGFITDSMLVDFPFLTVPDNIRQQRAIQQVTLLSLFFQTYLAIKETADTIAGFSDPTFIAAALLQVAALAIYLAIITVSIIDTALNLVELDFPPLRYYKAISDYDMMQAACAKLGYTFQSDFMVNEMYGMHTIGIPEAIEESVTDRLESYFQNKFFNVGYPRESDTIKTAGQLFDFYLNNFDTQIFIYNGVVRFELSDYFQGNATQKIKPTMSKQTEYDDSYSFNDDQVWGRKYYKWTSDYSDIHSIEVNQDDVKFEAITEQINTTNPDLVNLTGLDEYTAPFALVKRKTGYSGAELYALEIFQVVDSVTANLNQLLSTFQGVQGVPNFTQYVTQRIGVGVFERHYWGVTRKVWGVPVQVGDRMILKQPENFLDYLSQTQINNNYNTGLYVKNNNYALKVLDLPYTDNQFAEILQNNFVEYEGYNDPVKALKVEFYPFRYRAEIGFELPDGSAFNTKTTIL